MLRRRYAVVVMAILTAVGCGPVGPQPAEPGAAGGGSRGPRTITMALTREPYGFINSFTPNGTSSGGINLVQPLAANRLQVFDDRGRNIPELATSIPSVTDGTWTVGADGTMETIWKLQTAVKWHDGAPFTADDVVFGYQAATAPGVVTLAGTFLRGIADVTAIDPFTVSVKWKSINATADSPRDNLPVLPKHLLERELQTKDPDAFGALAYWTTDYIGNGPFRLTRWIHDEQLEFAAFEDYFRGRPRVDRLVVRIIPDNNTQAANVFAGEVDVIFPIDVEQGLGARERWEGTANQVLVGSPGNVRNIFPQNRETSINPRILLDSRVRRALYRSVDRQAVSEATTRGLAPIADSVIPPFYDIYRDFEGTIPQYPYDLQQAQRELFDIGFSRGPDGVMRMPDGREFAFEITTLGPGRAEREQAAAVIGWKQLGMNVSQRIRPSIEAGNEELRSKIISMEVTGGSFEEFFDLRLSCNSIPAPANSWRGRNSMGWCHPDTQRPLDRLQLTVPPAERTEIMRDFVRVTMTEMALMPLYWDVDAILVAAGVHGVSAPTTPGRYFTWNIAEWAKD